MSDTIQTHNTTDGETIEDRYRRAQTLMQGIWINKFGMNGHERPYTSEGSLEIYQPGMIISVEPGLYVEGVGDFRHSDTLLITEDGTENWTLGTPKRREDLSLL